MFLLCCLALGAECGGPTHLVCAVLISPYLLSTELTCQVMEQGTDTALLVN